MNKENKGAAGLRRSAIAERIKLREEWSALKEVDGPSQNVKKKCTPSSRRNQKNAASKTRSKMNPSQKHTSDALRGVVALVEVGPEARALPLRAALAALGASVLTSWSPLVTHLVWADSGCRAIRAKARALACRLVSPLWVEACAASNSKLNERTFPAAARHSDLPSPKTLRQLLKKAEHDNVPLIDLLSDSKDDNDKPRLRISTDTDNTDKDTSRETAESRVNTAPRRPLPTPAHKSKSRRKLFTHKEAADISSSDDDTATQSKLKLQQNRESQLERRQLARAERMARKLLANCREQINITDSLKPRIVLTGMTRIERQTTTAAIQKLNGLIQKRVNKKTTHVLLGSCNINHDITGVTEINKYPENITLSRNLEVNNGVSGCPRSLGVNNLGLGVEDKRARTLNSLLGAARGARVLHAKWALDCAERGKWIHHHGYEVQHLRKICQKARVERTALGRLHSEYAFDVFNGMRVYITPNADQRDAAIQLLKLCGAIVLDGEQYGGIVHNQNGGLTQNGGVFDKSSQKQDGRRIAHELTQNCNSQYTSGVPRVVSRNGQNVDVIVGNNVGHVNSKWVFDSVAAARMRTTRRYINMNSINSLEEIN